MEGKLPNITTSCEILKVKFQQDATKAKEELDTLHVKYEMCETRIKAILAKHQFKLNRKVKEALARAWDEWSSKAAELQVF